jgi:hypothetical protein
MDILWQRRGVLVWHARGAAVSQQLQPGLDMNIIRIKLRSASVSVHGIIDLIVARLVLCGSKRTLATILCIGQAHMQQRLEKVGYDGDMKEARELKADSRVDSNFDSNLPKFPGRTKLRICTD